MAQIYDSDKIRIAARAVRALSNELNDGISRPGARAEQEAEALQGRAGEALRDRLQEMRQSARRLYGQLDDIAHALDQYADVLEETAKKLKAEMQ